MNIIKLSWSNLKGKPLNTFLSLLLLTLGVALVSMLLILNKQLDEQFKRNISGIDMVVGAKGSPLQLILSSVYHIDNPTGNIPLKEAEDLLKNPIVDQCIPLAYGDSYKGYRIVGTNRDYTEHYGVTLKEGNFWQNEYEVTAGAVVAQTLGLKIGDTFHSAHGLVENAPAHDHADYTIVGIFEHSNSVVDQLLLTDVESVWAIHHEPEDTTDGERRTGDEEHNHDSHEGHNHDSHEGHNHNSHEGHNHDSHEGHNHNSHEGHNHDSHEGHNHNSHEGHNHDSHEEHKHDSHEGHNHDSHEGHNHDSHEGHKHDSHEGHNHDSHEEYNHEKPSETTRNNKKLQETKRNNKKPKESISKLIPSAETLEGKELTAMLVKFKNKMGVMTVPRMVNEKTSMQAAVPAIEVNRLFTLMGVGMNTLRAIAFFIILISGISVFVSLFNSLKERRYELALMRSMGASRGKLFLLVLLEGLILSLLGFVLGMLVSRIGLQMLSGMMESSYHYGLEAWSFLPQELILLLGTLGIGVLAAFLPALQAFHMNISETLAKS